VRRQRFRTITPPLGFAWLYRISAIAAGVCLSALAVLGVIFGPDPKVMVNFLFLASWFALSATRLGVRLGVNDETLLIAKNMLSMKVVRWTWIASFEWRHNLRAMGQHSKRLWVILDDGQQLSTPVVRGTLWWLTDRDIRVSQAQAEALVAQMQQWQPSGNGAGELRTP
jgi:hypothetical protein